MEPGCVENDHAPLKKIVGSFLVLEHVVQAFGVKLPNYVRTRTGKQYHKNQDMAKFEMHTEVKHYIKNGFYIWTQSKEADTGRELSSIKTLWKMNCRITSPK